MAEINYQGVAYGPPQCGKTFMAATLNRRWLAAGDWCFVHDPNHNRAFRESGFVSYEDTSAWRASMRTAAAGKKNQPRGAVLGGSADALIALVDELGRRWNTADDVRMRIRLTLDEGSETDGAEFMTPRTKRLIGQRRHRGVGLLLLCQDATMIHPRFVKLATHVYVFPGLTRKDIVTIEERVGLRETGALLRAVDRPVDSDPKRRGFVIVQPGRGFTTEIDDVKPA